MPATPYAAKSLRHSSWLRGSESINVPSRSKSAASAVKGAMVGLGKVCSIHKGKGTCGRGRWMPADGVWRHHRLPYLHRLDRAPVPTQQASLAGCVLGGVLGQARVGGVGQGFRARFVEQGQCRSMCLECAEVGHRFGAAARGADDRRARGQRGHQGVLAAPGVDEIGVLEPAGEASRRPASNAAPRRLARI